MPAEGFPATGRTIADSNNNRLASRIEADRCNQRTNINASGIRVCRLQVVGDYTLDTTQTNSNMKFPVVT